MSTVGWESQDALQQIHRGLAWARGSVRQQRDAGRLPVAVDRTRHLVGSVDDVLRTLPDAAVAAWSQTTEFVQTTVVPAPPLRIGTTRIGLGADGVIDLPILVPLLGAGHVLVGPAPMIGAPLGQVCPEETAQIVDNLVLRALATTSPGQLVVIGDGWLPQFLNRDDAYDHGLCFDIDPADPAQVDNLLTRLRRNIEEASGPPDKYRLLIISELDRLAVSQREEFLWLLQAGPAAGIHAIVIDSRLPPHLPVEYIEVAPQRVRCAVAGPLLEVRPDGLPLPDAPAMTALNARITGGGLSALQLQPSHLWHARSDSGLAVAIGDAGGRPQPLRLGDSPAHALIGGRTGSGKTNLIYGLILGLTTNYSPDEVELYLLDFKESVSFASFARTPGALPHARLIGVHINSDREFGLAALRDLHRQLGVRAAAVKAHGVVDLRGLRAADPNGRWPRIVAVIDEFQILLAGSDRITAEAVDLLEDLARRGRSFGIHLVLSSQVVSGIDALFGRPALVAQLTLRVALPGAQRVLADNNPAAERLQPYHAVLNDETGLRGHDRVVRLPHFDEPTLQTVQDELARRAPHAQPVVFDGSAVPPLDDAADFRTLAPRAPRDWTVLLGRSFDVADAAASARLAAGPARNLAVIGTKPSEVYAVLGAAVRSLARQVPPGAARFSLLIGGTDAEPELATRLAALLDGHEVEVVARDAVADFVEALAARSNELATGAGAAPHFIVFVGVDAAGAVLRRSGDGRTGHEQLRRILLDSAETGIRLLGWWRSVNRLKDDLSDYDARLDEQIGLWVALDAQGNDLSALTGGELVSWSPRPQRALWFDRSVHDRPQPMILFGVNR
ncbi:cell division protein FtsK [Kribbella sandramycini]|uniref:Cell division protein FtsK n=1 Tax=Kribbella sandramycini TaxID=60450 RepID=A0A7Y4L0W9_9ACTN|nr:FtsK/SpoIIIE domain-containing protein [Kribbella sandramycini]MBB6564535.1 hypothetical protein [Kribbella sandramycini]NOL42239.1 cell division protein FtsK [Kribbella sandramycini]